MIALPLGKFNDHRPCDRRDISCLLYHVTLRHHMVKRSCDYIEEKISSFYVTTLLGLVTIGIVVVNI